ncbi:MAG: hypothetical protein EOR45_26830 [Mesorhizobium sp.]|nr:MAG: hypothetical protein EOR45_26830 [Mesorhizobium sp.]TIQ16832.1 MAG: hypothetical protein E5X51_33350 [Mesorhizobium sp.]
MRIVAQIPLVLLVGVAAAGAEEFDPTSLDLAALIECRADVPAYNGLAFWLSGEAGAAEKLGWKEVPAGNPFLRQYELPATVRVFGYETASIVFTATGPLAALDGVSAPDLARELGISPEVATPEKFLGEKIVVESSEEADGMTFSTRIGLNVSTVDSHPGKVLAGCSYALDVN